MVDNAVAHVPEVQVVQQHQPGVQWNSWDEVEGDDGQDQTREARAGGEAERDRVLPDLQVSSSLQRRVAADVHPAQIQVLELPGQCYLSFRKLRVRAHQVFVMIRVGRMTTAHLLTIHCTIESHDFFRLKRCLFVDALRDSTIHSQ